MSDSEHGTPFDENCAYPIDDWSRAVFEQCRNWPLARTGRWFMVNESWLRLRIEEVEGERIDPLCVAEVDTADQQILVDCGSWASPITPPSASLGDAAKFAVGRARELVEGWLAGNTKLVDYYDETGWRGSKIIDGGHLPSAIEPVPVELGNGARIILKTARRADWRSWRQTEDGFWLESECDET